MKETVGPAMKFLYEDYNASYLTINSSIIKCESELVPFQKG